ncbi:MAG TPA: hypothetical protein PLU50_00400, partial [Pseudobdellovibrionaceae bacterium]|nr:hypothetical protein [Pseudobdellovibrionaceae bacterium]
FIKTPWGCVRRGDLPSLATNTIARMLPKRTGRFDRPSSADKRMLILHLDYPKATLKMLKYQGKVHS